MSKVNWKEDESYDRYKRPRWQPTLLLVTLLILILAVKLDIYHPRLLILSIVPSSVLSLDQRVDKIMSLTPLIGEQYSNLDCCSLPPLKERTPTN